MDHPYEHRAHYNPQGQPCHCPWGHSEDGEHLGSVKEASKLEWLEGRPDMQTPEGQQFLNLAKGLNANGQYDQYSDYTKGADKMLPWMAREWKKGRLQIPGREDPNYLLGFNYKNHNGEDKIFNSGSAEAAQKSLEEMKKHGQGTDVMQHSVSELVPKIQDFQNWQTSRERKDLGEPVHQFNDSWTVRQLHTPEEFSDEGQQMGHCLGQQGYDYPGQSKRGEKMYYSLRDAGNMPHATMEVTPDHWKDPDIGITHYKHYPGWTGQLGPDSQIEQFYGKGDAPPLPEYEQRMGEWLGHHEVPMEWEEDPEAELYREQQGLHPVASHTRPLYYRWVYSPQKGVTINSNKEAHPALVKYHSDLSGDINDANLTHGFASAIGNGWRITDLAHQPVDDPYIVQQVVRRLNLEDGAQIRSEGGWQPSEYDYSTLHYGLPKEVTQN